MVKNEYVVKAEGGFRLDEEQLRRMITIGIIKNRQWILQYLTKQLFGPDLLTSQEVLDKLKISRSTLQRWEDKGIITPIRVGRTKRYAQNEIINLKKSRLCTTK